MDKFVEVVEGNVKTIMRLILTIASHFKPESVQQHHPESTLASSHHQQSLVSGSVHTAGFVTSGNFYDVPIPGSCNSNDESVLTDTSKFTAPEYQVSLENNKSITTAPRF